MAWHILIPLVWLAASLGFALGWAVRALLERRVAREPRLAVAPSERTPGSAGTTARRTRGPASLGSLALKGAGAGLALLTASAGLAYAGVDFPGTVLERTFRTVLRFELPNQGPAEIGARPSRRRGSSAVGVDAAPLQGAPASGCEAVGASGEVTSSDRRGARAGEFPCSEAKETGAGKRGELRPADGSGSGGRGAVQSVDPPGDDAAGTESIGQEGVPAEDERSAEEGAETSPEARPSEQETRPSPDRGTKGGGEPTKESSEGQTPSRETSGKGRGSPPKESIGGASSDDRGARDKGSSPDDQAPVDQGRRADARSSERPNGSRGGKRGAPPEVG